MTFGVLGAMIHDNDPGTRRSLVLTARLNEFLGFNLGGFEYFFKAFFLFGSVSRSALSSSIKSHAPPERNERKVNDIEK